MGAPIGGTFGQSSYQTQQPERAIEAQVMATARERQVARAVAAELRAVMGRRNMKRLPLARAAGIPNSTLNNLLDGIGAMDVDQLARICAALDLEPGAVLSQAMLSPDEMTTDGMVDESDKLTKRQKTALKRDISRETDKSGNNGKARSELPSRGTRRSG